MIAYKLNENSTEQLFNDIENNPREFYYKINFGKIRDKLKDQNESILENLNLLLGNASIKLDQIEEERFRKVDFYQDSDFALVELEEPFDLGKAILPFCLLKNDDKRKFENSFIRKSAS